MADEKIKRLKPRKKPYKKTKFDNKIFTKRTNSNSAVEDAEFELEKILDNMGADDEI